MVGENVETLRYEIPKIAMKLHEQFMFGHIISFKYTLVGEIQENVNLEISKNAMKSREQVVWPRFF